MIKWLRRLYLKYFPDYEILETCFVDYGRADQMIKESANKPEGLQWHIYPLLEDFNQAIGYVYLYRRKRISK